MDNENHGSETDPHPQGLEHRIGLVLEETMRHSEADPERRKHVYGDRLTRFMGFDIPEAADSNDVLLLSNGSRMHLSLESMTDADWWDRAPAYAGVRKLLEEGSPDRSRELPTYVPHRIRYATLVRDSRGRTLMELRDPTRIGLPWGVLLPHDASLFEAAERRFRMPFNMYGTHPRFMVADRWDVAYPNRAEVLFVRHVRMTSDPEEFIGLWQEEGTTPLVWVGADTLTEAVEGRTEKLRALIAVENDRYRAAARWFAKKMVKDKKCKHCGSILRSHCESVPPKPMLVAGDDLALDEASRDVLRS